MFFSLFNRKKNKSCIALLIYALITCYLITSNGCQTTTADRYTAENLRKQKKLEGISHIILKNGTYINTEDKEVFYFDKYKDSSEVIVFITKDTSVVVENGKHKIKVNQIETMIPLSKVQEVYVTKTEVDAGKTILLTTAVAVGTAIAALIILFLGYAMTPHHNSCPYIYSFDGDKYIYDAEPLGGVICEGLARTDYSRLEYLVPSNHKFKLFVRNENEEQQHLDEMNLVVINHEEGCSVTPNCDGKFFKYKTIEPPSSVTDENGNDITAFFKAKDDYRWQTDMQNVSVPIGNSKHSLKFKFNKPHNAKNALLFFNGGISNWGSQMVKNTLSLRGNKIDEWYEQLNKKDVELNKLHNFILNEGIYYLKVNLLDNGEYKVEAIIPGGGPKMDEDKVFNISLENVNGDFVELNLNPAKGYWKFEQIGLIYDYQTIEEKDINVINASFGKDKNGKDVTSELKSIDKKYLDMPEVGNSFELFFDVPESYSKNTNELFLRTNGWYEIDIDKTKPEQTDLLFDIFNSPGKIVEYSMILYNKKIKELTELKNIKN